MKKAPKNAKTVRKLPDQWRILPDISPDERQRLRQLYQTDPETFKQELAKIVRRLKQEKRESDRNIQQLVSQYKRARDTSEKKALLKQLQQLISSIFYTKMQHNKQRLETLEKQVRKLREQYEFRQKNAEKIIQARLDYLTGDANFEW
ncbi:MAG: hypothetical protein PHV59_02675 [Victivallales bacterium]|nr:hypothetical protein [Victivallales bacterium]